MNDSLPTMIIIFKTRATQRRMSESAQLIREQGSGSFRDRACLVHERFSKMKRPGSFDPGLVNVHETIGDQKVATTAPW